MREGGSEMRISSNGTVFVDQLVLAPHTTGREYFLSRGTFSGCIVPRCKAPGDFDVSNLDGAGRLT